MVIDAMKDKALAYLYKCIKKSRISLGRAEERNADRQELDALNEKIAVLEWLTEIVLKEVSP